MPAPDLAPLQALRRLRRVETDAARRALGDALTQEASLTAKQSTLVHELAAARRISGTFDRDAFAAWFARVRAEQRQVAAALLAAAARTAAARTALAQRRVAETAAESALASGVAAKAAAAAQREQVILEDASRALRRSTDPLR
jgi:hypothetical protein